MHRRRDQNWKNETSDRPRVVIECTPDASPDLIAEVVERQGFAVRTCSGELDRRCDLLEHGTCALVSGADVVVNLLGQHHAIGCRIAEAVQDERRPPALVIEAAAGECSGREASDGAPILLARPLRKRSLLEAIQRGLASRDAPTPRWEG
jgi:hypothetical protein